MVLDSGGAGLLCCYPQYDRRLAKSHLQEDEGRGTRVFFSSLFFCSWFLSFSFLLSTSVSSFPSVSPSAVTHTLFKLYLVTVPRPRLSFCLLLNIISMIRLFSNLIHCLTSKHINTVSGHYCEHLQRDQVNNV